MIVTPLSELKTQLTKAAWNKLSHNIEATLKGSDHVILSPVAKRIGVDRLEASLASKLTASGVLLNSDLAIVESDQRTKLRPQSIRLPWKQRRSGIMAYFLNRSDRGNETIMEESRHKVLARLRENFAMGRLNPWSLNRAIETIKWKASAGLPHFISKRDAISKADSGKSWPCVLFTRTQSGKTRPVWGYPLEDIKKEIRYSTALTETLKTVSHFSGLSGPDAVDEAITALLKKTDVSNVVSVDYSGFDSHLSTNMIKSAFFVVRTIFQKQYAEELGSIEERFRTIGIVTPEGVWSGEHGNPSGSQFTTIVNCLAHALGIYYVTISLKRNLLDFQVQGDDGVLAFEHGPDKSLFQKFNDIGFQVNDIKTVFNRNYVVYLQRFYHEDYVIDGVYRGIYPIWRAFNRLMFPERWIKYSGLGHQFNAIRSIAIMENCKWHPWHEVLVRWFAEKDPSLLQVVKGKSELEDSASKFEALRDDRPLNNQYSDDMTGINAYRTVEILRKL